VVRPVSAKQLADAESRARLRAFNKGLLAKPGTAQRPIAVHSSAKACPNARQRQGTTRRALEGMRLATDPLSSAGREECSRAPTISALAQPRGVDRRSEMRSRRRPEPRPPLPCRTTLAPVRRG
jgi:hypothetical protein